MVDVGATGDGPAEGAATPEPAPDLEIDEPVFMKENVTLGLFQTQILECNTKPLFRECPHDGDAPESR